MRKPSWLFTMQQASMSAAIRTVCDDLLQAGMLWLRAVPHCAAQLMLGASNTTVIAPYAVAC